jgi:hypothetical protein
MSCVSVLKASAAAAKLMSSTILLHTGHNAWRDRRRGTFPERILFFVPFESMPAVLVHNCHNGSIGYYGVDVRLKDS